jgi:hypothetical protein
MLALLQTGSSTLCVENAQSVHTRVGACMRACARVRVCRGTKQKPQIPETELIMVFRVVTPYSLNG